MKQLKSLTPILLILTICISYVKGDYDNTVYADDGILSEVIQQEESNPQEEGVQDINDFYYNLHTYGRVAINQAFGEYQKAVDEAIYYSLCQIDASTLVEIFGDVDTPIFQKAKEYINPCMAMATTWGEAGASYAGVSLTTMMDFTPSTYSLDIDWISVAATLEQVNSDWYVTNATDSINVNSDGKAYLMPVKLLQFPSGGDRSNSLMVGLGVGPYQITSSDWNSWDIDVRVNPVYGYKASLQKCGSSWTKMNINPISDLTMYAVLSLCHQGGGLVDYEFGRNLISIINREDVQQVFNDIGYRMYSDALEKQSTKQIDLSNINVGKYVQMLQNQCGINFSSYTGGVGSTNKGNYVATHCLRYCFYKYYYTDGL